MAAYEVLLLNTAIPQIQAAQSGDTYLVPRDIAFSAALTLTAGTANGVPYLSSPGKVLTTGSALTFDGNTVRNNQSSGTNSYFRTTSGTVDAYFGAATLGLATGVVVGSFSNNDVVFYQNSSEAMRLTSTGLGIGTNNPASRLHVTVSGSTEVARFETTTDNTPSVGIYSNGGIRGKLRASTAEMAVFSQGSIPLLLGVNDAEKARITSDGNLLVGETASNSGNNGLKVKGQFALTTAQTFTASGSVNDSAYYIVCYALSATCTLTLPTPANNTGRLLNIVVQSAQQVVSASSNVTAIADGAVGTAILPATAGKWAQLWCDGAYWNIIATNV